jgi:hypothetical protein
MRNQFHLSIPPVPNLARHAEPLRLASDIVAKSNALNSAFDNDSAGCHFDRLNLRNRKDGVVIPFSAVKIAGKSCYLATEAV